MKRSPLLLLSLSASLFAVAACAGGDPLDDEAGSGGSSTGSTGAGGGAQNTGGVGTGGALFGAGGGGNAAGGGGPLGTGGEGTANTGGATGSGGGNGECAATGFHVQGSKLYDANCNEFILRGVNYPYVWYADEGAARFEQMASRGANAVRVVLATGDQWTKVDTATVTNIISWLKTNNMIGILEVHDFTGYGESAAAPDPTGLAVAYWNSVKTALVGQEAYVMINIANEAFGNSGSATTDEDLWETFHIDAVKALRDAGFTHTLIVDAPNWGQDWRYIMRDNTNDSVTNIFEADSQKNVVFSVHMYDIYSSANVVQTYFDNFMEHGVPLIVGEFAADHGAGKDVDEGTIMAQCESRGLGYLGWSWSGNSSDLASLDLTNNFNAQSLTPWGEALINDSNGIVSTAQICSVY